MCCSARAATGSAHFFERMPGNLERVAAELERPARTPSRSPRIAIRWPRSEAASLRTHPTEHRGYPHGRDRHAAADSCLCAKAARSPTRRWNTPLRQARSRWTRRWTSIARTRLTASTRVYGVIGDPIGHSLSPVMQNAGFQARTNECRLFAISGARSARISSTRSSRSAFAVSASPFRTKRRILRISTTAIRWPRKLAR